MASRPVKLKLLPRTVVKAKSMTRFMGRLVAGDGIVITTENGASVIALSPEFGEDFLTPLAVPTLVTASGTISVSAIVVQTNQSAAIIVVVPDSAAWATQNSKYGLPLTIQDISGNAASNNVTINFTGGQTASGLASLSITTNYGIRRLMPKFGGGWVVS